VDRRQLGHQIRGMEEVGHWPRHQSRGVLGVKDAGGQVSGGRSEGRRTGGGQSIEV
jgi:hypothetical protein